MRIALVSSCASPVRRHAADSIETIVWLLADELTRLGHDVTTFACAGSEAPGRVIHTLPGPYARAGAPSDWQLCEYLAVAQAVAMSDEFDLIHSHNYLLGLPIDALCRCPMLHTLHVTPYGDQASLRRAFPDAEVTAISRFQWSTYGDLPAPLAVIHHGIDTGQFTYRAEPEDYLLYFGRFTPGKGPLAAIAAARETGLPLVLAGPENGYYKTEIAPQVDGRHIRFAGAVYGADRDRLLGGARALLYPINAPEPFGLVMIEAMACGTPVAAIDAGAVREVVDEGVTGATCADATQLPHAIDRAIRLGRSRVRQRCLERFTAKRMAGEYVRVYERLLGSGSVAAADSQLGRVGA